MRSLVRDPDRAALKILRGSDARPVKIGTISKRTGIPMSSLYKWRERPDLLTLANAIRISKIIGMTDEEWVRLRNE